MHLTFRATGIRPYPETASWQAKNAGANDGGDFLESLDVMAERVGFEPTLPFRVNTLSKRAPSATRPSLRRKPGKSDSFPEGYRDHAKSG
jgi:hypothetical protein